jgi:hypothetical protein
MLESQLEARLRQRVRAAGGRAVKLAPTEAGLPDRLVMMPGGRAYLVELKTDTGRLSPIQRAWHTQAALLGHTVTTLYGAAQLDAWVEEISK